MGKKIVVVGTGYVGLSLAVLLAQHNHVIAVDIIPEKVEMINNRKSPIQDDYIEDYLTESYFRFNSYFRWKISIQWCRIYNNCNTNKL